MIYYVILIDGNAIMWYRRQHDDCSVEALQTSAMADSPRMFLTIPAMALDRFALGCPRYPLLTVGCPQLPRWLMITQVAKSTLKLHGIAKNIVMSWDKVEQGSSGWKSV